MKNIILFGAGRSATDLIDYLANACQVNSWVLHICDANKNLVLSKIKAYPSCKYLELNIHDSSSLDVNVISSDLVISLLPPNLHFIVADACLKHKKDLLTASYVDNHMRSLDNKVKEAGVLFLCEMGLDPGIDHMSSMHLFESIDNLGGEIISYLSSTGGLVAPESDNNPWHYKFSWNPKNVVLAGKGTAQFIKNNQIHYTPYDRIFNTLIPYKIDGYGQFDSYPNRNSLKYQELYGLKNISTLYRGTLRKAGFSQAWAVLVKIGYTQDNFVIEELNTLSYSELTCRLLEVNHDQVNDELIKYCQNDIEIFNKLNWLGILSPSLISLESGTPADVLENILLDKWTMQPHDKDLVIMLHEVSYALDSKTKKIISTLTLEGENSIHTAMSKCVGLPLAIYAEHILLHGRPFSGVHIPVKKEIYQPVMQKLATLGITFNDTTIDVN